MTYLNHCYCRYKHTALRIRANMIRKPDKAKWVLVLSLLEISSRFILLQCMINDQTFVLIISHTKLKMQIKACKSYMVKDLLKHFTFAKLLSRYNFEINISCKSAPPPTHTHKHAHARAHARMPRARAHTHTQQASTSYVHLTVGSTCFGIMVITPPFRCQ